MVLHAIWMDRWSDSISRNCFYEIVCHLKERKDLIEWNKLVERMLLFVLQYRNNMLYSFPSLTCAIKVNQSKKALHTHTYTNPTRNKTYLWIILHLGRKPSSQCNLLLCSTTITTTTTSCSSTIISCSNFHLFRRIRCWCIKY